MRDCQDKTLKSIHDIKNVDLLSNNVLISL